MLGGDDSREGIVEIAYNGRWGMLCDDGFTDTDAQSVCQGLGFGRDNAKMMSLSFLRYTMHTNHADSVCHYNLNTVKSWIVRAI